MAIQTLKVLQRIVINYSTVAGNTEHFLSTLKMFRKIAKKVRVFYFTTPGCPFGKITQKSKSRWYLAICLHFEDKTKGMTHIFDQNWPISANFL